MKFCVHCGNQMQDSNEICMNCGCRSSSKLTLTIYREKQWFLVNPPIDVTIVGNGESKELSIKKKETVNIELPAGIYTVYAKGGIRKANVEINLDKNRTLRLGWNRVSGQLELWEV